MIGTRKRQAHQLQDGAQQPCGLAKRQAKQQSEREGGLDGAIGVNRLSAPLPAFRSPPGVNSILTDPQGDVAAIAPRFVIVSPVLNVIGRLVFWMSVGSFVGLCHAGHRWLPGFMMSKP